MKPNNTTNIHSNKSTSDVSDAILSGQTNASILLTIDVEDWFQVENFKQYIPFSSWAERELRVEKNTHSLLDLFDSLTVNRSDPRSAISDQGNTGVNRDHGQQTIDNRPHPKVCATFFVLGWLAERLPHLVREIHARGHEVASHGYNHHLCNQQSHKDLRNDLVSSKKLLEDIIGAEVYGYRAPSFSINDEILKIIQESGYLYDSSYNSFGLHGRYGKINIDSNAKNGIAYKIPLPTSGEAALYKIVKRFYFYEVPISNLQFTIHHSPFNIVFPWGGGGYFRLIPYFLFKRGVESILKKDGAYVFYMHPWEIDPEQPRVHQASPFFKFRHYTNLGGSQLKLSRLIQGLANCYFTTCSQYLNLDKRYCLKRSDPQGRNPVLTPDAAVGHVSEWR